MYNVNDLKKFMKFIHFHFVFIFIYKIIHLKVILFASVK